MEARLRGRDGVFKGDGSEVQGCEVTPSFWNGNPVLPGSALCRLGGGAGRTGIGSSVLSARTAPLHSRQADLPNDLARTSAERYMRAAIDSRQVGEGACDCDGSLLHSDDESEASESAACRSSPSIGAK